MLSPHACVIRHACGCSGTPQSRHYMISQLVPEGCIRCNCLRTPQGHQHAQVYDVGDLGDVPAVAADTVIVRDVVERVPAVCLGVPLEYQDILSLAVLHEYLSRQPFEVAVSKGWPLHDRGTQNRPCCYLFMNYLWDAFPDDLLVLYTSFLDQSPWTLQ
jgi:hypothetical protein